MKRFFFIGLMLSSMSSFANNECDPDLVKAKLKIIKQEIQETYKKGEELETKFENREYQSVDLLTLSLNNLSRRRIALRQERMNLILGCQ